MPFCPLKGHPRPLRGQSPKKSPKIDLFKIFPLKIIILTNQIVNRIFRYDELILCDIRTIRIDAVRADLKRRPRITGSPQQPVPTVDHHVPVVPEISRRVQRLKRKPKK